MSNITKLITPEEREELRKPLVITRLGDMRAVVIKAVQSGLLKYSDGTPLAADGGIKYVPSTTNPSDKKDDPEPDVTTPTTPEQPQ